ncbi:MAG: hypothetical protein ACRDRZ_11790 [Pseudonocardiaceae bacterium]
MTTMLVGGLVLIGLGLLLGSTWTIHALEGRFRHQAAERRRLNEEWEAVRAFPAQPGRCPYCAGEVDWYHRPVQMITPEDDD